MLPPEEYAAHREKLAAVMAERGFDLVIVTHRPDLFYLTGTVQASYLFLPLEGAPWLAARRGAAWARQEADLRVEEFSDTASLAKALQEHGNAAPDRIGLAFDTISHEQFMRLRKFFPLADIIDLGPVMRGLRQCKSAKELEYMRLAGRQLDGAVKTVASLLRLGQSELELAIRVEAYMRRKGHPGIMRARRAVADAVPGFVLAGVSTLVGSEADMICTGPGLSPIVPFGPSSHEFRAGEPVLFDYCGSCAGYMADESRMLSLGPPPPEALKAYEAMRRVLRKVEERLGPGECAGDLYELACREAKAQGYEGSFMGVGKRQLKFVGHGIGLELDEEPFLAKGVETRLEPGMTVAIEPKVVLALFGVIGVENTYVITDSGWERLTNAEEEWRQVPVD